MKFVSNFVQLIDFEHVRQQREGKLLNGNRDKQNYQIDFIEKVAFAFYL